MRYTIILSLILSCLCSTIQSKWQKTAMKFNAKLSSKIAATFLATSACFPMTSYGFGPVNVGLEILSYKPVDLCNGQKPIMPGMKAAEGLFPACIEVEVNVNNPESKPLTDVSIYGFVKDNDAGNSVLPNNPDFKSDAGQYAMLKTVPPGQSKLAYQFVAAVTTDPKKSPLPTLTFFKTKAISFPGGAKFKPLDICEIDPRADGCDGDEDE